MGVIGLDVLVVVGTALALDGFVVPVAMVAEVMLGDLDVLDVAIVFVNLFVSLEALPLDILVLVEVLDVAGVNDADDAARSSRFLFTAPAV